MSRRLIAALLAVLALGAIVAPAAPAQSDDPQLFEEDASTPAQRTKAYEKTIAVAIDDIQDYWEVAFPDVYGEPFDRIPNNRIFAAEPGIKLPKCQGEKLTYRDAQDNAFYCYVSNFVAYDDVNLFPQLYRDFGDLSIALVLAHEWGHAIQDRADNADAPTIYKELQADCYAGSWVRRVADGKAKGLALKGGNLDTALTAMLQFRDAPGSSPGDPSAHGSGFDRVAAFQDGFDEGAEQCAPYFEEPPVITEIAFTSEDDAASGGNVPAEDVIPLSVELLNDFYLQVEPGFIAPTLDNVFSFDSAGTKAQLPVCGGTTPSRSVIKNRVFYCIDDGYFAFDEPYLQHVYEDIGDFGVATLLANPWATYVQINQGFPGVAENADNAVLGADCYTGGFAAAMYNEALTSPTLGGIVVLSPGDLDETVQAFIDYTGARDVDSTLDVTFVRLRAFRDGFLNGYGVCQANYASTGETLG